MIRLSLPCFSWGKAWFLDRRPCSWHLSQQAVAVAATKSCMFSFFLLTAVQKSDPNLLKSGLWFKMSLLNKPASVHNTFRRTAETFQCQYRDNNSIETVDITCRWSPYHVTAVSMIEHFNNLVPVEKRGKYKTIKWDNGTYSCLFLILQKVLLSQNWQTLIMSV